MTHAIPSHLSFIAQSDLGLKRKNNEDSLLTLPEHKVFVVADGMGGADAGEVASARVVKSVEATFSGTRASAGATLAQKSRMISQALNEANDWIWHYAREQNLRSCGTTVVALVFDAEDREQALVLHAGDSRAYRFRAGHIEQLTRDHSFAEASGIADIKLLPARLQGVITRAVGIEQRVSVEDTPVSVADGDIFMLCSDGLSSMVAKSRLEGILCETAKDPLSTISRRMIAEANRSGGHDNVSVVLVRVDLGSIGGEYTPTFVGTDECGTVTPTGECSMRATAVKASAVDGTNPTRSDPLSEPSMGTQAIGFSALVRLGLGVIVLLLIVLAVLMAADRKLAILTANRPATQQEEHSSQRPVLQQRQDAPTPAIPGEEPEESGEVSEPLADDSEPLPAVSGEASAQDRPLLP
ncbi:MAG: protein phosphatase 2C domain-containing protein, partial [bacterium]